MHSHPDYWHDPDKPDIDTTKSWSAPPLISELNSTIHQLLKSQVAGDSSESQTKLRTTLATDRRNHQRKSHD